MIQKNMPTLIFGNVVLQSHLMGTDVLIFSEDMRSYWTHADPPVSLNVPLHELPNSYPEGKLEKMVQALFEKVKSQLDESYSGGYERACADLCEWILSPTRGL